MRFVNALLRFYAYLFHLALSTFLIGIAILARMSNQPPNLEMLPFSSESMISRISLMSLIGFICIFLAWVKIFEFLFPLWSLAVVILLIKGFFFSSYSFAGPVNLKWALLLILGTGMAFYGAVLVLFPERRRRW